MVVPSGLADSLNVPGMLGAMGGFRLLAKEGVTPEPAAATGSPARSEEGAQGKGGGAR
jgi:hypothetical protein